MRRLVVVDHARDRRPRGGLVKPLIFLPLAVLVTLLATQLVERPGASAPARAQEALPLLGDHGVVPLADRISCVWPGPAKTEAGVLGKDTGGTVIVDGTVYWTFGDTLLSDGTYIPNTIAWSDDTDASDCIDLQPKQVDGRVAALLPRDPDRELSVWPSGMEETSPGRVQTFYTSVAGDAVYGWRTLGAGMASFDTLTLAAERELGGALLWTAGQPLPTRTFADGQYVYVFLDATREAAVTETILGRVPKEALTDPAAYEYWQPGAGGAGAWQGGLWDAEAGTWDPAINEIAPLWRQSGAHNGIEVAYNEFLGRWTAVYTSAFLTTVSMRTAPEITGPWDEEESTLVRCPAFHTSPNQFYVCYSGKQHEYYERDGGRTIYISYANSAAAKVYLHEVRLGAAISQHTDGSGRALYLPARAKAPDGYTADGVAFYASDIAVPGFAAVHRWEHVLSGAVEYGSVPPGAPSDYRDLGIDFYAPPDAAATAGLNVGYAPVYRWQRGDAVRYSPLDLAPQGFARGAAAFFAACPDSDDDSLTDCAESFLRTSAMSQDSDRDGCSDAAEIGPNPATGGARDPANFWDFFDTPDAQNVRDGTISGRDLLRVVGRYGSRGDASIDPLAGPIPPAPGYHPAFDRGGSVGPNVWNRAPADGGINGFDIVVVLSQFGHNCQG